MQLSYGAVGRVLAGRAARGKMGSRFPHLDVIADPAADFFLFVVNQL